MPPIFSLRCRCRSCVGHVGPHAERLLLETSRMLSLGARLKYCTDLIEDAATATLAMRLLERDGGVADG
jgi:hypothetical protein